MSVTVDLPVPQRVLAIGAHPDDIEFGCGATLAKWSDAGCAVHLAVCTDGSKGSWDPHEDLDALVAIRAGEQHAAASLLGAQQVHFLGAVDGELQVDTRLRSATSSLIRRVRADVVIAHDPWRSYRVHPDHVQAGRLAVEAIVAARDPHFYPEDPEAPHRPRLLLLFEAGRADHVERVDGHLERKIDALLAHRSQWRSTMGIHDRPDEQREAFVRRCRDKAQAEGIRAGVRAGEAFRVLRGL